MKGLLQIEYVTSVSCIPEPVTESRDTATLVIGYLFDSFQLIITWMFNTKLGCAPLG